MSWINLKHTVRGYSHRPPSGTDAVRLMSHTSAWEILRALCGEMAMQQAGGLTDLDKVSVRVPHVAADLRSAVDRRRHETSVPFALHSS